MYGSRSLYPLNTTVCSSLVPTPDDATGSSKQPNAQQVARKLWAAGAKLSRCCMVLHFELELC